ncbi:hypothetical protein AB0P17_11500 [Streptomyces sp. NPDC088124]|uniref:hypothetical protein n=1 Tax=Streptomyces sp. NPDC088124 TaxID=3154654 RepID=UPI003449DE01
MVRAALFAAICVLLAAIGHAVMSGSAVPWWAMSAAFVSTGSAAWVFARAERGLVAVTGAVVVAQAALHTGFSLAQTLSTSDGSEGASFARRWATYLTCGAIGPDGMSFAGAGGLVKAAGSGSELDGPPPVMSHGAMEGMGHAGAVMTAELEGPTSMAHSMAGMSPTGMILAHLVAALLCGVWLAHGERAAFRLLRAFAGWMLAPLRILLTPPAPCGPPRAGLRDVDTDRRLRRFLLASSLISRGPPVVAVV